MNNHYEVKANGKYHIIDSNIVLDVTEEDIVGGSMSNIDLIRRIGKHSKFYVRA